MGLVFQALNPKNVTFDSDGHVLLFNFAHADFESSTQQCGMPRKLLAAIMPEYVAPEMVLGWARNAAVDCWSFGVLVYFMLFGTVKLSVTKAIHWPRLKISLASFWKIRYSK
jgi:serine/threonine protein kinase